MSLWEAIWLAVVEGLTEYLPVSSTGHLIIASALMGLNEQPFTKDFTVMVQFGAILSVVFLYWRRFVHSIRFYQKLFIGFLPAAIIGLLVKNYIDLVLGNVLVVAVALVAGGIVLCMTDRWFPEQRPSEPDKPGNAHAESADERARREIEMLSNRAAAWIGLCQCVAFVPGVSRSASTLIGGLWQRLSRQAAAEFSFLLAVPTLTGASALKLVKLLEVSKAAEPGLLQAQLQTLIVGNVVSFVVGVITIKAFIGLLARGGLKGFGYYRIAVGLVLVVLMVLGVDLRVL